MYDVFLVYYFLILVIYFGGRPSRSMTHCVRVEEEVREMEKPTPRTASSANGPASDDHSNDSSRPDRPHGNTVKDGNEKKTNGKKTMWVEVQKCFNCGKHGHNLPKCRQCSQAFYCDSDCQRKHWRKHRAVCRAAVAALARRATRERLARAIREKGADKVEGAEDDALCVICQARPVDPVEVSSRIFTP